MKKLLRKNLEFLGQESQDKKLENTQTEMKSKKIQISVMDIEVFCRHVGYSFLAHYFFYFKVSARN